MVRVFQRNGRPVLLGPAIASGGEGVIYPLFNSSSTLAKVYHTPCSPEKRRKLEELCAFQSVQPGCRIAWPRELFFGAGGECCGFLMPRATGVPLVCLHSLALLRERIPASQDPLQLRLFLLRTLYGLASGLRCLEELGALPWDISASNFLVNPRTAQVTFIDVDGYQLSSRSAGAAVESGAASTPEYLPPELLAHPQESQRRQPEHVRFGAAVLFFETLMLGWHPYQCIGASDPVANIIEGRTALGSSFGLARGYYPKEVFALYREALHPGLKHAFIQSLVRGHKAPALRTNFADWQACILRAARSIEALISASQQQTKVTKS